MKISKHTPRERERERKREREREGVLDLHVIQAKLEETIGRVMTVSRYVASLSRTRPVYTANK